jgi:hypothetical protein
MQANQIVYIYKRLQNFNKLNPLERERITKANHRVYKKTNTNNNWEKKENVAHARRKIT